MVIFHGYVKSPEGMSNQAPQKNTTHIWETHADDMAPTSGLGPSRSKVLADYLTNILFTKLVNGYCLLCSPNENLN